MDTKNSAHKVLTMIGGLADRIAGVDGFYWPDAQTPKKTHARSRLGRGKYGESLRAHFDMRNFEAKKAKQAKSRPMKLAA